MKKKLLAIDLYSGCGGVTVGLKKAGFKVVAAVENNHSAALAYESNHAEVALKRRNIRWLSAGKLRRELGLKIGELDVLAACPPCQGFSSLRTRNGAKRNRDKRNDLVREVLRFVRAFRPRAVMLENVPNLSERQPFKEFCAGLETLGYKVTWGLKNAADYGVPQRRKRLLLVAGRGHCIPLGSPARHKRTVRKTIGHLQEPGVSGDKLHDIPERVRSARILRLIRDIPRNGGSRNQLPRWRQLECHKKSDGFSDIYGRMAWDEVAPTITGGCFNPSKGRFLHPTENRAITMREAALLQSFPSRYKFPLDVGKQAIALMIGNALPPEFIRRQALTIRRFLETQQ
jgi:DNA (cytosine-5)-methyltransferase 1